MAGGGPLRPDNARFFCAPFPVPLHIVSVALYSLLGASQFAPGFRCRRPEWHRAAGRILVVAGLGAALSGLWMAMFYAIVTADSALLHALRLFFGAAMAVSILPGYFAIQRRDVMALSLMMGAAWMVNLAVAEWLIRRQRVAAVKAVAMCVLPTPARGMECSRFRRPSQDQARR